MHEQEDPVYYISPFPACRHASCSSTPEPEEEVTEEAVPEEVVEEVVEEGQAQVEAVLPEATPEEPVIEPVSNEELSVARQALERAEMVDGSRFAPDLMAAGYEDLKKAASLAESDPEQARLLLAGVVEKGDQAFELGKAGLKKEAYAYLDKLQASLLEIEADKFSPLPYEEVMQQFSTTRASIDAETAGSGPQGYGQIRYYGQKPIQHPGSEHPLDRHPGERYQELS